MNRLSRPFLVLIFLAASASCQGAETSSDVQELQWNVYLKNWQVLGPIAKPDQTASGLEVDFVENEAELKAGDAFFYNSKLYVWKKTDYHAIPLRNAFHTFGDKGYNAVAYAWTQFNSSSEQKAVLSVGYDDHFKAWLNGEVVGSGEENTAALIDQSLHEVTLRKGTNSLLIKVGQNVRGWEIMARLLPPDLKKPLLVIRAENSPNPAKLPPIRVELLDRQQRVRAVHYTSGGRPGSRASGQDAYYPLYAKEPTPPPAFVRYVVEEEGYAPTPQTVSWEQARNKETRLRMMSDRPLELVVVDRKSGEPLQNAQVWMRDKLLEPASDASGKIALPKLDPIDHQCWVVARGYAVERVGLKWPRTIQRVELQPGGKSLKGRALEPSGEPVAGVKVTSNTSEGYSPTVVTNERGEYELFGLPQSLTSIRPGFEAQGYIPFPYTQVDLTEAETTYDAILNPGATIKGVVTHQKTGQPLANVHLAVGEDRFGSNRSIEATTDAQGRYTLYGVPTGSCVVHAVSPEHAPEVKTTVAKQGEAASLDFQLIEGKPVTGRVVDIAGKPLSNVWIVTDTWSSYRVFNRQARTDADGNFTLPHMPDSPAETDILKQGYISVRNHVFRGGDTATIELKPEVVYTINIRDASNDGVIAGLNISIGRLWSGNPEYHWSSSEWETSRNYNAGTGTFTVTIDEPEQAEVAYRFRAPGYQDKVFQLPSEHKESRKIDIELEKAELFAGRIVEAESDHPIVGARICLVTPSDKFRTDYYVSYRSAWEYLDNGQYSGVVQTSDNRGEFHLTPPEHPETALLVTRQDGAFHFVPRLKALIAAHEQGDQRLVIPMPEPASLDGQILIGNEPLIGGQVKVHWEYPASFPPELREMFGVGGQVKTDGEGRFSFPALGVGRYAVQRVFSHHIGRYSTSQYLESTHVELTAGQKAQITLNRPPGITVRGRTLTTDGDPLDHSLISVSGVNDRYITIEMANSDGNGHFEIPHLAAGRYRFNATHYAPGSSMKADYTGIAVADLESGRAEDPIVIDMKPISVSGSKQRVTNKSLTGTLPHAVNLPAADTAEAFRLSDHWGSIVVICSASRWTFNSTEVLGKLESFANVPDVKLLTLYSGTQSDFEIASSESEIDLAGRVVFSDDIRSHPVLSHLPLGNNNALIVGRDGKLATEIVPLTSIDVASFATPVEEAESPSTARLTVTIEPPAGQMGPIAAELSFQAVDGEGKMVDLAEYHMTGETRQIDWVFLNIAVAKVRVTLAAPGIERQTQELSTIAAENEMTFRVSAPSRIKGTIDTSDVSQSIEGMRIRLYGWSTQSQIPLATDAQVDAEGRFEIPCYPGSYYILFVPLDNVVISEGALSVAVPDGGAAEPQRLTAVPAVDVVVKVSLDDGTPAEGAYVTGPQGVESRTDADGQVRMPNVRADGVSEMWAWHDQRYGSTSVDSPAAGDVVEIVIGQTPNQAVPSTEAAGRMLPMITVTKSDGEEIAWPRDARPRIVVIGELWRLDTQQMLDRARQSAAEQGLDLEVLSTDRSASVIDEWAQRLAGSGTVSMLDSSSLDNNSFWLLFPEARAFQVDGENRIVEQLFDERQPEESLEN
ncbi:carboxypeptidase-like regulatory domain-containing protein [Rubinisphaera margarita]|uniref:carboxypeptidase-like regulatory domain-containing protein n=1 Tax=Rubinisphaera margarita TaxID=2909586 RepID=UPI001EE8FFDC|nr:carboxypeptidase-like regulatory domain-containing protein [Rubinisphaera margarita]MCG6155921.1 carboxypeptidase-like regulatory domain-containing protein [Rubinisphaera margarita]